ncbi:MAG: hypothetical protein WCQ96_05820 [Patescibacteria group bacterium]|jgi:hypothetical protein
MGHVHETRADNDRGSRGIAGVSVLGGEGMIIDPIVWFLMGMIGGVAVGVLVTWLWMLDREDKMLESLIMDMDDDVVQEWIEEEEERRRVNK